ncbi:TPA: hypothetical protein R1763_000599 [Campylobacter lari]|uniref:hypothetical protein n=1 Tax=Campylobacter sp. IFREMER_LSEM_CL1890 TaxID=2911615 RepID=UPI001417F8A5|nr:hypothetical protein [Campylobacter sp. IFREMER_LSEM_CL1890]EDP6879946.1 hypothetical protein [Campylobacter lari]MCV3409415.1 hypothetical protein [Campylobacter sp. IFREMER_LSEM_CL1890]HEC1797178.1 hypothetical protein [Campylobacter lari]
MLSFFRKYILQLLICICYDEKQYIIRCHTWKKSQPVDTFEKSFEDKEKAIEYVKNLSKDFQIYYICTFFTPIAQGVVPSSNFKELSNFGVEANNVKCIPFNNALLYVSNQSLSSYKEDYEAFGGLDLLYSPFSLLYHCIANSGFEEKIGLYVYRYHDFVAMLICKNEIILFGSYFNIASQNYDEVDFFDDIKEEFDLQIDDESQEEENEQNYDLKSLEEMSKELDKLEDLDENEEQLPMESLENFSSDMKMIEYIISSVKEFYHNPLYDNSFLEEIVIFDEESFSATSLDYLENELFIKPKVELIDTLNLMNELVVKDLKL